MSKTNQKDAVYNAINAITGQTYNDGDTLTLTKEQKAEIRAILVAGFENDAIELKSDQDDLKKYVNGLLNNWLRKDKRFNGGTAYKTKNPGSRAGQGDAMIKNLRILLKQTPDVNAQTEIQAAITTRLAEIKPAKAAEIVDASVIPADLQHLIK